MAKLKLPEKAYKNPKYGDSQWHLCWAGAQGPAMVCGKMIFKELRVEGKVKDIDPKDLCDICLGAIGVGR